MRAFEFRQRLLYRMTANGVGEREGLDRNVVRRVRATRQHAEIGLDRLLQPDVRAATIVAVVVAVFACRCHHDRRLRLELMDRVDVEPVRRSRRKNMPRRPHRIETLSVARRVACRFTSPRPRQSELQADRTIKGHDA